MLSTKEQNLLDALEPHAHARGVEIVTLEVTGAKKAPVIRVYINTTADGGVSFAELTEAQSWIGDLLEQIDPFPGAYVLEVSSPGIDRPLRTPAHFEAAVGEQVRLKTTAPQEGRKHFKGTLSAASDSSITLETEEGTVQLPLEVVSKANVIGVVEF